MENRLIVLALGTFAIGTDSFVVAGILPDVARSLGIGIGAAGQLITVYAAAYAVLTPIMAALTARWPRRRVLLCGLVVFVFGNLATALSPGLALVLASRAVAGLGAAMFTPAASASAAALVPPERRGRALAMVIAGLSAATALGAPTGTVIGTLGSWRLTMWFVAALGALAALGVAALLPRIPGPPPRGRRRRHGVGGAAGGMGRGGDDRQPRLRPPHRSLRQPPRDQRRHRHPGGRFRAPAVGRRDAARCRRRA